MYSRNYIFGCLQHRFRNIKGKMISWISSNVVYDKILQMKFSPRNFKTLLGRNWGEKNLSQKLSSKLLEIPFGADCSCVLGKLSTTLSIMRIASIHPLLKWIWPVDRISKDFNYSAKITEVISWAPRAALCLWRKRVLERQVSKHGGDMCHVWMLLLALTEVHVCFISVHNYWAV